MLVLLEVGAQRDPHEASTCAPIQLPATSQPLPRQRGEEAVSTPG